MNDPSLQPAKGRRIRRIGLPRAGLFWLSLVATSRRRGRIGSPRATLLWFGVAAAVLHFALLIAYLANPLLADPIYSRRAHTLKSRMNAFPEKPAVVVMVGTSRTGHGFEAGRLDGVLESSIGRRTIAFNFGCAGTGPITQQVYLKRLLKDGIRPDLFIVEFFPFMFQDQNGAPVEAAFLGAERLAHSEAELVARYGYPSAQIDETHRRIVTDPWTELRFQILARVRWQMIPAHVVWRSMQTIDSSGWQGPFGVGSSLEQQRDIRQRTLISFGGMLANWNWSRDELTALGDLLDLCQSERIPTVVLWMPEASQFRNLYPPAVFEQMKSVIEEQCQRTGASWVNARDWIADDLFFDYHHLTPAGSVAFTDRLGREIIVPALKTRLTEDSLGRE